MPSQGQACLVRASRDAVLSVPCRGSTAARNFAELADQLRNRMRRNCRVDDSGLLVQSVVAEEHNDAVESVEGV